MHQDSGAASQDGSGSRSHKISSLPELQSFEGLMGLKDMLPRWGHSQSCWQEASVLPWLDRRGGLSPLANSPVPECSQNTAASFPKVLAPKGVEGQKLQCLLWDNLGSDVPALLPYPIGFAYQS